MKFAQIIALVALAGIGADALACRPKPSGDTTPPDLDCYVTWDFTKTKDSPYTGDDPELTYTGQPVGTTTNYPLVARGFSVVQSETNGSGAVGTIRDNNNVVATDYDGTDAYTGSPYAIGVQSEGESWHMGTKIDNLYYQESWSKHDTYKVRDAVLLDFQDCIVSIDELTLLQAYGTAQTDFQLWAMTGNLSKLAFDGNNISTTLTENNFSTWGTTGSDWELVASKNLDSTKGITRVVDITGTQKARYFVLIAGDRNGEYNDAFRLAGLRVTCDPNNCKPPASNDGVTPIPGTLALLGIGALATRRRFLKQS